MSKRSSRTPDKVPHGEISAAMIARSATVTVLPHWRQAFHPIRAMESAPARSAMNGGSMGQAVGFPEETQSGH